MTDDGQQTEADDPDFIKKLRADSKRLAEVERELAAEKRERLFAEAGVPNDGPAKWFRKAYDGELSVDAIKAEAADLLGATPPPAQEQGIPAEEIQAHQRQTQAATQHAVPMDQEAQILTELDTIAVQFANDPAGGLAATQALMKRIGRDESLL